MGKAVVTNIRAKSIIVKSNLPGTDYVVNPYVGCVFGCSYCYASFIGRFNDRSADDWGSYVLVKENAAELFAREIRRKCFNGANPPTLLFSSVTDPYQPVEKERGLTRRMLEILAEYKFAGKISILTKSMLAARDIDVFKRLRNIGVGITVNTVNKDVKREFEPFTPDERSRLKALEELNASGVNTYAFVGPIFPDCYDNHALLSDTLKAIRDAGTKSVYLEHINLNPRISERLSCLLGKKISKITMEQKKRIDDFAAEACEHYGLAIIGGAPIIHGEKNAPGNR